MTATRIKLRCSDQLYAIFEFNKDEFGASHDAFLDAVHPDDRDIVAKTCSVVS